VVASGRASVFPAPVAGRYPRDDVSYVMVTDAEPAAVSIARQAVGVRPIVQAFAEIARRLGEELAHGLQTRRQPVPTDSPATHQEG